MQSYIHSALDTRKGGEGEEEEGKTVPIRLLLPELNVATIICRSSLSRGEDERWLIER